DWVVAVHDDDGIVDHVCLRDGGVATSGTVHHQVDPSLDDAADVRDGATRLVQATVVGGSAMWAEVCATWAMVTGPRALDDLERWSLGVRLQFDDGSSRATDSWSRFALVPPNSPLTSPVHSLEGTR
ncbi:MAG: FAD:protein FMN transferase, partial [Ilumatobacteraceae bacterium]